MLNKQKYMPCTHAQLMGKVGQATVSRVVAANELMHVAD